MYRDRNWMIHEWGTAIIMEMYVIKAMILASDSNV